VSSTLQLLTKVDSQWKPEGASLRFEDETRDPGAEQAARYGDAWVAEDPLYRQYRIDAS
jgi:hypothetical protein